MYKVYCDDKLIYCKHINDLIILDANLELELGKTGLFSFVIYPNNRHYYDIVKMKSIITILQNDNIIFKGRVLNEEIGFYNQKLVTCEGVLAFLLDSIIRPTKYENITPKKLLIKIIDEHNKYVDDYKKFKIGTVQTKVDKISFHLESYGNSFEVIQKAIIEQIGGYLLPRFERDGIYIDIINDFTSLCNQPIVFGINLLDIIRTNKGEDIITSIIPIGNNNGSPFKLSLGSTEVEISPGYNGKEDVVYDKAAINRYGCITTFVEFDNITTDKELKEAAINFLKQSNQLSTTIEIKALDLSLLDYRYDTFKLGSQIMVQSKHHVYGELSDKKYLVDKLSIDILNPQNSTLNITSEFKTSENKSYLDQSNATANNIVFENNKVINTINNGLVVNTSDINSLNGKVSNINTEISTLNNKITKLQGLVDENKNNINNSNTNLSTLEQTIKSIDERLKVIEGKLQQ